MLTFLVLGYVPGTHIQLNFNDVLLILSTIVAFYLIVRLILSLRMHIRTHQLLLDILAI